MKTSEATRNLMLDAAAAQYTDYVIKVYDGTVPAHPESSIGSSNLLVTIVNDAVPGVGLSFEPAAGGILVKATSEVWRAFAIYGATKVYCRFCAQSDNGAEDVGKTLHRWQFTMGTTYGEVDFFVQNPATATSPTATEEKVTTFQISLAESAIDLVP